MKYEYSNLSKLWGRIILLLNLEVSTRCVCWKKPPSLSATRKFSRLITFVCNAAPRFTLNYMSVRCYAHTTLRQRQPARRRKNSIFQMKKTLLAWHCVFALWVHESCLSMYVGGVARWARSWVHIWEHSSEIWIYCEVHTLACTIMY